MRRLMLPPLALIALAACKPQTATTVPEKPASAPASATAIAPTPAGGARKISIANPLFDFDYAYPEQAGAIPALKHWLDADLAQQRAGLASDAHAAKAEAAKDKFDFNPWSLSTDWRVVTDLPGWLSLSAMVGNYSGGAHPNYAFDTILWDKAAGVRRDPLDLFRSKPALSAAITPAFCAALNQQRAKKRGAPVDPASTDDFDKCIDPLAETVILGSADHRHFTRIGILIAPYEAGPYAEGDYEVTLPVTPAVLATVKPEYRTSFAIAH